MDVKRFLLIVGIIGIFFAPPGTVRAEDDLSPASKEIIENTMSLLGKIMEKAIVEASAKAVELLPEAKNKTDAELDAIMSKTVTEITRKILHDEKFEEAVIEAVTQCSQEAFNQGIEEALKEE